MFSGIVTFVIAAPGTRALTDDTDNIFNTFWQGDFALFRIQCPQQKLILIDEQLPQNKGLLMSGDHVTA